MDWISRPDAWIAFATLTVLELVLGIDNIVFISILSEKVEESRQRLARLVGLGVAMFMRVALLFSISWVMSLTRPLFDVLGHPFSGRDLILVFGGLFLLAKATREIHDKLEGDEHGHSTAGRATFASVIAQIAVLDLVFSLDSVITAVGMADDLGVMVAAVVVAVLFMMVAAEPVSAFVTRHPTVKMLALSFLLLIGMTLMAEGLGQHISKGYIYFAMGFSVFVESLNLRLKKPKRDPIHLRGPEMPVEGG
ncbi:MAG: TerC family protein [Gemmatimonadetes bacterium]|nr:TerC family protein [Gemmatimonadota bacterium]NNF39593.1 TerC family protein [Gemmatimonadota bacterium]